MKGRVKKYSDGKKSKGEGDYQSHRSLPRSFESSGAEEIAEEILLGNCYFVFLLTMKMINQYSLREMLLKIHMFCFCPGMEASQERYNTPEDGRSKR